MKPGKRSELEALFKAERERHGSGFDRIYVCEIGNVGRLAIEAEFQDMADMEKKLAAWKPPAEFGKEVMALIEPGSTKEIWRVV